MKNVILASASPQRHRLLLELVAEFEILPADIDETNPPELPPREAATHLACEKANASAEMAENRGMCAGIVIAADTVVAADSGQVIGKPIDDADAFQILRRLSGSTHSVVTGLCVLDRTSGDFRSGWDDTRITMSHMTDEQIWAYIATGEAAGKAGAYGFQPKGDPYVKRIDGSFSNVIGLPLELLRRYLQELGFFERDQHQ